MVWNASRLSCNHSWGLQRRRQNGGTAVAALQASVENGASYGLMLRPFAAVVVRHGTIMLQVERGNSAVTDMPRLHE
jgi:hypothetical protein